MVRVAVGGFQHETNTFVSTQTTYAMFEAADGWPGLTRGAPVFDALAGRNIGMAGLLDGARDAAWDIAPLAWCGGGAGGVVTRDAFDRIANMLLADLEKALPLDGVLFDLHGAMVSEHHDDADAAFLTQVRRLVGDDVPIVCSLDLHANISPAMMATADLLTVYRTYPHLDMAETGRRAAQRLGEILQRRSSPYRALRQISFPIPTTSGCTLKHPTKAIYALLEELEQRPGVTEMSFACGFSPADIPDCGPAVLAYGEDAAAVDAAADALAAAVLAREADFVEAVATVEDAVSDAMAAAPSSVGPIILADIDDNPGAGEFSDTTFLLETLVRRRAENAGVGLLYDPAAVEIARSAGRRRRCSNRARRKIRRSGRPPLRGALYRRSVERRAVSGERRLFRRRPRRSRANGASLDRRNPRPRLLAARASSRASNVLAYRPRPTRTRHFVLEEQRPLPRRFHRNRRADHRGRLAASPTRSAMLVSLPTPPQRHAHGAPRRRYLLTRSPRRDPKPSRGRPDKAMTGPGERPGRRAEKTSER